MEKVEFLMMIRWREVMVGVEGGGGDERRKLVRAEQVTFNSGGCKRGDGRFRKCRLYAGTCLQAVCR